MPWGEASKMIRGCWRKIRNVGAEIERETNRNVLTIHMGRRHISMNAHAFGFAKSNGSLDDRLAVGLLQLRRGRRSNKRQQQTQKRPTSKCYLGSNSLPSRKNVSNDNWLHLWRGCRSRNHLLYPFVIRSRRWFPRKAKVTFWMK